MNIWGNTSMLNIHALSSSPHQALIVILMCPPNTPHITMLVECVELTGKMPEPLRHLFKGGARYGSHLLIPTAVPYRCQCPLNVYCIKLLNWLLIWDLNDFHVKIKQTLNKCCRGPNIRPIAGSYHPRLHQTPFSSWRSSESREGGRPEN